MAVDLTPGAHFQRNTTALALPVTFCTWVRFDTTPAQYRVALYHGTTGYSQCLTLNQLASGVVSAEDENFITRAQTDVLAVGTWYFLGVSVATGAGNFKLYWRAEGEATLSSDAGTFSGSFAQQRLFWGTGPGDTSASTHSGAYAYARAFAAELSEAQILAESQLATAVATEWADWPMASTATSTADVSGNSRTLTFNAGGGSQADDTDPNIGGATANEGTTALSVGVDLAATGQVAHAGTADLSSIVNLAATGSVAHTGTGGLGLSVVIAATGATTHSGTADLAAGLAAATAGSTTHTGAAGLPVTVGLAAIGNAPSGEASGTAGLPVEIALAATGSTRHEGTAALSVGLVLAARSVADVDLEGGQLVVNASRLVRP